MTRKYIAWGLGIMLVLVLGIGTFFWKSQDKVALAPAVSNETVNMVKDTPATETSQTSQLPQTSTDESSIMETAPTSDASITDITKNIESDMSYDQTAIGNDASAEMKSLEDGNAVINDLGQSYDESKY